MSETATMQSPVTRTESINAAGKEPRCWRTRAVLTYRGDSLGVATFGAWDPDTETGYAASIPADVFEEMGRPETVTLTVRTGDRLND